NSGMAAKPEANSGAKTATGADARENAAANANRDAKANRDANATMADDGPESLGDINDLLLASDGTIKAVIIGVGGFLGIGEKAVAVDISRISAVEQDGERWLMLEASKEELENAPEFTAEEDRTAEASDNTQRQAMNERAATDTNKMDKTADANDRMQNDKAAAKADDRAAENQTVDVTKLSAEELIGTQVYGAENEVIGEVSDVVLDGKQQVEAFIVDVGGFLGIGEKPVALDAAKLQISKDEDGDLTVHTSFTEARLEKQKAYSEEAYKSDKDSVMLR
ncbi:MAG: PRC-barrel domain-containing protein, partial [Flavobacteriaceae bacterium]